MESKRKLKNNFQTYYYFIPINALDINTTRQKLKKKKISFFTW